MSMFKLITDRGVEIDAAHRYIYKDYIVTDSVTRIVSGAVDSSNVNVIKAAVLGTKVHHAIEYIIDSKDHGVYGEDIQLLAIYIFNRAMLELVRLCGGKRKVVNGRPLIFSWQDVLVGGCPDALAEDVVIEFKTSTKASRAHEKQVLCYMEALSMDKGLIVYADPSIPCVVLQRGTKEYSNLKRSVQRDLNKYFEPPVMAEDNLLDDSDNVIEKLEHVVSEIKELKKKLAELESERQGYLMACCNYPVISTALDDGKDVILGSVAISKVFVNAKKVDYDSMISDGVYNKYVEINPTSYVKCVKRS